jgi:hypothetical protein
MKMSWKTVITFHPKSRIGHIMRNLIHNLLLFLIFLTGNTYSGTIDPHTPDEKYVEYGSKFECVLEIMGSYENSGLFSASAVAIDKNWVLTAAHVVKGARFAFIHNDEEKKCIIIDEIICHKDFEEKNFGIADIALCHTSSDLGLDFYPELYIDSDEVGKICSISGYGFTGNFHTGLKHNDGKKRAGSNHIEEIHKDLLICKPSIMNKTELEFLIATGDSGGGLFIDGKLAGINSCVTAIDKKPDSTYNDEGGHTRVSKFLTWIKEHMQRKRE